MVGVKDNGNAVDGRNRADVVSGGNRSGNRCLLVLVVDTLSGEESSSSLRSLEDDGRLRIASGLEGCNNGRGRCDVHSGNGVAWSRRLVLFLTTN
jgi:hypothetical protein